MDRVDAVALPIGLAFQFFARCESEVTDLPGQHAAELVFMGEDRVLGRAGIQFQSTEERPNQNILISINVVVDVAARYRFDLSIDGRAGGSWPLEIRLRGEAAGSETPQS